MYRFDHCPQINEAKFGCDLMQCSRPTVKPPCLHDHGIVQNGQLREVVNLQNFNLVIKQWPN